MATDGFNRQPLGDSPMIRSSVSAVLSPELTHVSAPPPRYLRVAAAARYCTSSKNTFDKLRLTGHSR
jgi:hypothetical protein